MSDQRCEEPCFDFVAPQPGESSDARPCGTCGWLKAEHFSYEHLEQAIARGEARIVVDRPRFRVILHKGFRYVCTYRTFSLWANAAGNKASDYRGSRSYWSIQSKEPETKKYLKPSKMDVETLIKELNCAIEAAEAGRWQSKHWKLVAPDNVQLLLTEISTLRSRKAA
jgi:hypothetical protein